MLAVLQQVALGARGCAWEEGVRARREVCCWFPLFLRARFLRNLGGIGVIIGRGLTSSKYS
jgi:hypothetical protein